MKTPVLFTPVRLGAIDAPNRIVMAPLTRMRAGPGRVPTPLMAEYYAQRAAAGLIVSEAVAISQQGTGCPNSPGIYTAEQVAGWQRVTDAVHQAGGRIFLQLWHMGRVSHPSFQPGGGLPVAPSAITWEFAFSARRHSVLAIGNGAGCGTPPVGSTAAVATPVIAVLLAFLVLRASNRNAWARSWGSGQGCEGHGGRRCIGMGVMRLQRPMTLRIRAD